MAFPGDPQQPGGWTPHQPPQSPYGPADDRAAHGGPPYDPPYGPSRDSEPAHPYGAPAPSYDQAPGYGAQQGPYGAGGHDDGPGGYGAPADGYGYGYGYGAEPGGDPGSFEPGEGRPRSGGNRKLLLIGAGVTAGALVIGGGTALMLSSGGDGKPKPAATTSKAAPPSLTPSPTPTATGTGRGQRLMSRATDPRPLTVNEVFKYRRFKGGGRVYAMTMRSADRGCSRGAHGIAFRKVLVKAGCTQVLRATFSNGTLVGTIGVLNLRTQAAARAAQRVSRLKDSYVTPLPGAGIAKKVGQGLALTTAEADGHYLILSWVQYPSGKKIARGDYGAVSAFVKYTTLGSNLRAALNYRSMEGKPA